MQFSGVYLKLGEVCNQLPNFSLLMLNKNVLQVVIV